MSFRAEVREFISEGRNERKVIAILLDELAVLRMQNKDLMDRLMARNFEELKVYQSGETKDIYLPPKELELDEDETNAGEIL